jgi:hypothetical protein
LPEHWAWCSVSSGPLTGAATGIGLVLYFVGATISRLRGDFKGVGPAAFMLVFAAAALALRIFTSSER